MSSPWQRLSKTTRVYRVVSAHDFLVDVHFPPKDGQRPQKHPVIILWHPGALITRHRAFQPWLQKWVAELALLHSAIIVTADYRLLPEHSGEEILDDVEALWQWTRQSLQRLTTEHQGDGHIADLGKVIVTGGSAGGFCATHMALRHPESIRALLLQYPLVEIDDEVHAGKGVDGKLIFGKMPPSLEELDAALSALPKDVVVTQGEFERFTLMMGGGAHGKIRSWIGGGEDMNPILGVKKRGELPQKVFLVQGKADSAVPYESVANFVNVVETTCKGTEIRSRFLEGTVHAFDFDMSVDNDVLKDGVDWIVEVWLEDR